MLPVFGKVADICQQTDGKTFTSDVGRTSGRFYKGDFHFYQSNMIFTLASVFCDGFLLISAFFFLLRFF